MTRPIGVGDVCRMKRVGSSKSMPLLFLVVDVYFGADWVVVAYLDKGKPKEITLTRGSLERVE